MYDAIIIGARCAGATTAMLLARKGHRVLLVDRARFPSEIPHGHFIHRGGPARLAKWGLLDAVLATNCPPVTTISTDFGDPPLVGENVAVDGIPFGIAPRRSVLDNLLVEAAVEAGAELREGFAVQDLLTDGGRVVGVRGRETQSGFSLGERGRLVIGADGRNSFVARSVGAEAYETDPTLLCWYFSYWSGVAVDGLEHYHREGQVTFVHPTNDDLTTIFVGRPIGELAQIRVAIEEEYMAAIDSIPGLSERVRAGERVERIYGATQLPGFLRKPYGPGWALEGDAGHHKDPYLALGVADAFRDAESLAEAADQGLRGERTAEDALARYESARNDAVMATYQENQLMARLGSLPEEKMALMAALQGSAADTRHFYLAREGLVPEESFFNDENLGRIMGAAAVA
jgi:flavin-dependent dehydrogenase